MISDAQQPSEGETFPIEPGQVAPPPMLTATTVIMTVALAVAGRRVGNSDPAWLLLLLASALPLVGLLAAWDRSWRIAGRPGRRGSTILRLGLVALVFLAPGVASAWSPSTEAVAPFLALAGFAAAFDWSLRRDLEAGLQVRR